MGPVNKTREIPIPSQGTLEEVLLVALGTTNDAV